MARNSLLAKKIHELTTDNNLNNRAVEKKAMFTRE